MMLLASLTILLFLLSLFLLYLYQETTGTVLEKMEICTGFSLEETISLLHLSDLHFRGLGRAERRLFKILERVHPDLILLTGDYIGSKESEEEFLLFLKELSKRAPVYAVLGNHDFHHPYLQEIFLGARVTLLRNEGIELNLKGLPLTIIGVESPDGSYSKLKETVSSFSLQKRRGYRILLSHTYHSIKAGEGLGLDLYLVGDTHGGQISIPYVSERILKKRCDLDYIKGMYSLDQSMLYVNRGLGWVFLPIRVRSRPEVAVFELK